ncbi:MAG: nitroreductase [Ponticaulis sp.]|nr:nitroreductase [Ponticaulis sp.]
MTQLPFQLPQPNEQLSSNPGKAASATDLIARRRSTPILLMDPEGPGPDKETLHNILEAAIRVPDHRKLAPWKMTVFTGDAREHFGITLAERFKAQNPDANAAELAIEAGRLKRAPVCVTVVSSPDREHKTPVWEQEMSAGALCLNLLYAAQAAGFAACWLSEWWSEDEGISDALGLSVGERIVGNIFIGTAISELAERPRPVPSDVIRYWPEN